MRGERFRIRQLRRGIRTVEKHARRLIELRVRRLQRHKPHECARFFGVTFGDELTDERGPRQDAHGRIGSRHDVDERLAAERRDRR